MAGRRKVAVTAASLALALGLAVVSGEVMARLYYKLAPQYGYKPDMPFIHNADTGWIHKPGWTGRYVQPEFDTALAFNADGFRSSVPFVDGTPEDPVVAVLGDSFVEGLQVPEDALFTSVAERALAGRVAQVQNYGVSSLGPPHYLKVWRKHAAPRKPAVMVAVVYTENDPINSSPDLQGNAYGLRPNYVYAADGRPADVGPFALDAAAGAGPAAAAPPPSVLDHFVLRTFVRAQLARAGEAAGVTNDHLLLERVREPAVDRALEHFRWALARLVSESREAGAVPVLVAIPPNYELDPALWRSVEELYARSGRPHGLDRQRMAAEMEHLARELGVELIRPATAFAQAMAAGKAPYLARDRHLSAEGHRILGTLVAETVDRILKGPSR